ncbi:MAG: dihydrolipoyl dehydrogenase [Epulopiscium sp.]|nr:dihydrolipoyl dehydrogenase [Candidatus Epulonipiscium sp.]
MDLIIEKSPIKPTQQTLEGDIAILGGGPGGYVAALQGAKMGATVILIEEDKVGGTCLNRGCIPTKALVRSAEIYHNITNAEQYGLAVDQVSVNMEKVIERKNNIVDQLVQGIEFLLKKQKIIIQKGKGKLIDEHTIEVDNHTLIKAKNIIIATGSKIAPPPFPIVHNNHILTSDTALDLTELPKHIVIVGGGIIGMEFAFIYARFGVKVTVIEYMKDILSMLDTDVLREISRAAKRQGIKIYTKSKVLEIQKGQEKNCIVRFEQKGKEKEIASDKVLIAVGRIPSYENIGLENINIKLNPHHPGIDVNSHMQTNIPHIYAIGDVTNIIQLAHVASYQGIVAIKNILGENKKANYTTVPSVIFTSPEIAVVGISEQEAKEKKIDILIGKFPFSANGKALTYGETRGFVKIIKEKATGKIIGSSIIGPHASDLIAEVTLAIQNGLTAEDIIETIHAHPTTAEAIHEGVLSSEGGALHLAN